VIHYVIAMVLAHGYTAIFVCLMVGIFGLPIPDETLLFAVGVMS